MNVSQRAQHSTRSNVQQRLSYKHVHYVQLTKIRHEDEWNKFWNEDGGPRVIVHIVQQAED